LVMMSVGKARALGIDPSLWVFLHGCADTVDHWHVSERQNYHSSPAIRMAVSKACEMAGRAVAHMEHLDLYSCFPAVVEIACDEIGIREDDPRGLTITGGLPFFGGPGNNYVTHSIAEMMNRVRAKPGSFGLCTGNGHSITKHSAGIYSTEPTYGTWKRENAAEYQRELDAMPIPRLVEQASGAAKIETYTVMHRPDGPELGIVIGRLDESGDRFLANTPNDWATLLDLQETDSLNRPGRVSHKDGQNIFIPEG